MSKRTGLPYGSKCSSKSVFFLFFVLFGVFAFSVVAQEFSLDDDPTFPLTGPINQPYRTAEDEFGFLGTALGPSPSLPLGTGLVDSDALLPGPVMTLRFPLPPFYVDAFSANHKCPKGMPDVKLRFSVDRGTGGVPGSAVDAQAMANSQPGDIFETTTQFTHPCFFPPGAVPPPPHSSVLIYDHETTFGLLPPAPCPPIVPGSHDNVDAFNEFPPLSSGDIYFCLHPGSASRLFPGPHSAAEIYISYGGVLSWPTPVFATAGSMGLDGAGNNTDSIDALVVFDRGNANGATIGTLDPGIDRALFSLAPGSQTLAALPGCDPATIFWTDFNGTFQVYANFGDLGLTVISSRNVDALEIVKVPPL